MCIVRPELQFWLLHMGTPCRRTGRIPALYNIMIKLQTILLRDEHIISVPLNNVSARTILLCFILNEIINLAERVRYVTLLSQGPANARELLPMRQYPHITCLFDQSFAMFEQSHSQENCIVVLLSQQMRRCTLEHSENKSTLSRDHNKAPLMPCTYIPAVHELADFSGWQEQQSE